CNRDVAHGPLRSGSLRYGVDRRRPRGQVHHFALPRSGEYDRTVAFIRQLQAKSTTWSVELYNCNAFVADIANFMGLKVPSSSWIYPKVFVTNMRKINTGHPEAANEFVLENVKEMSNPTQDGRAMIASGMIHPENAPAGSASPVPNVTIGAVRVSNRPASSAGRLPGE